MGRFLLGRLGSTVLMFFAVTLLVFVVFYRVPDGPRARRIPPQYRAHGSSMAAYGRFVWRLVRHGDLGDSVVTHQPVRASLVEATPVTLSLVAGGLVVWLLISLPLGLLIALRPRSLLDRAVTVLVLVGVSVQPVTLGLLLSWFFGHYLDVLPARGYCSIANLSTGCDGLSRWAEHLLMPWLAFGLLNAALFTTMTRTLVLEQLGEEYVRTAQAKGAGTVRIVRRHVLQNVLSPLLSVAGVLAGTSLAGVIFIESAFDLPGLGGMLRQATLRGDLPLTAGATLFLALGIVVVNLAVDVAYAVADPRLRTRVSQ